MPAFDAEFWNRRTSVVAIAGHLGWVAARLWHYAPSAGLTLLLLNIIENIGPAFKIYVTRELVDMAIATAGTGASHLHLLAPWLLAFAATQLHTQNILWHFRNPLHLRLRQKLAYALNRLYIEKCAGVPLAFFETSESYDQLKRAEQSGLKGENCSSPF